VIFAAKIDLLWLKYLDNMSVSATFNKSKTNQIINYLLERYGKQDDYDEIIEHALAQEWIKTSNPKAKDSKAPREPKDKGQSKWTAYQKWAKKWADWNDIEINRATMKEIYAAYNEDELKEWERVAQELNAGKNIKDIENKPEIKIPQPAEQ
tara:strand:+ start:55 stop:510 length:456 start_codon:yes stop_codon:yes gene_type:complete